MHRNSKDNVQRDHDELEQRLTRYYATHIEKSSLPDSSWNELSRQLKPRIFQWRSIPSSLLYWWREHTRAVTPLYVLHAFMCIAYTTQVACSPGLLRCTLKPQMVEPRLRVSVFIRPLIHLTMPFVPLAQTELTTLLAMGLARYQLVYKSPYIVLRLLYLGIGLLAIATILFCVLHVLPAILLVFVPVLVTVSLFLLGRQTRQMILRADSLVVDWLGREQTCQGLHALANYARRPYRGRWNEPSFAQRITRICGVRHEPVTEHPTLVR